MTGLLRPGVDVDPSLRPEVAAAEPLPGGAPPPPPPGRSRGRRYLHRFLVGLNVVLGVLVLATGAGLGYVAIQNGRITRIDFDDDGGNALDPVGKGDPINILVVGSDTRAFAAGNKADCKAFGCDEVGESARSDTMMIIRIDPKGGKASILSIARDLYVDLEGGGKGRINEAFASKADFRKKDPARLTRTITKNFGVPVHHYVEVNFAGFRQVVEAIGGVKVFFPFPARDSFSLLNVKTAGCVQLNGDQALSYVRARHYEYQENGRWRSDPTGDLGRIQRQQDFMRRVIAKAVREGLTNPVKAVKLVEAGIDNVETSPSFGLREMRVLATQMKDLDEGKVTFFALTGEAIRVGEASVLRYDEEQGDPIVAAFGAKVDAPATGSSATTPPTFPKTATVRVFNGAGRNGLVADSVAALARYGVSATSGGNGVTTAQTQVRHRAGSEATARALVPYLGGGATLAVDRNLKAGQIEVVLGSAFTGIVDPKAPVAATTTAPTTTAVAPPSTVPPKGSDPSVAC